MSTTPRGQAMDVLHKWQQRLQSPTVLMAAQWNVAANDSSQTFRASLHMWLGAAL